MSFLSNNEINNKSQYYQNIINNEEKHIYNAYIEDLKDNFREYYNASQKKFFYLDNYIQNYVEDVNKKPLILKELMDSTKHPELNSISYYNPKGNINYLSNKKEFSVKYLISMLKTNLIKRFIVKGS